MTNTIDLTGSQTATNLAAAFVGESQARNRYTFYAEVAREAGLPTLSRIFLETADNERGHGEMFFEYLSEGLGKTTLTPEVLVPVALGDTAQNLAAAAEGEHEEWINIYPGFGRTAEREGFKEIAESFFRIATIEKRHYERYRHLLDRLNRGMLFSMPVETVWVCTNCGLHIRGRSAPLVCPACHHSQSYFMTQFDEGYPFERV